MLIPRERAVVAVFAVATERTALLTEALDLVDPTDRFDGETYFLG